MLTTLLILVLAYFTLVVILWSGSRFIHNYLYTEIPPDLHWRAPAAAGVVWLVALAWPALFNALVDANKESSPRWPINFHDVFLSPKISVTTVSFKEFVVPAEQGRRETRYRKNSAGEYLNAEGRPIPAASPPHVLVGVTDDNQEVRFNVLKDPDGYIDRSRGLRYRDDQGRIMAAEDFGRIVSFRTGQLFLNFFGALLSWAAWFVAMWLLLLFQWQHALAISIPVHLLWSFVGNFIGL